MIKSITSVCLLVAVACGLLLNSCIKPTGRTSKPKYLIYDEEPMFIKYVFDPTITICMTSNSVKGQKYRDWAKSSLTEWIDAIRPISPKPLTTTVEVIEESPQRKCVKESDPFDPKNPMMTIEVTGGGPGGAGGGRVNHVALSGDDVDDQHIMIHEMGHSFGLGDLYDENLCPGHTDMNGDIVPEKIHDADDPFANKCTEGAVMNGAERPLAIHLQPDDIAGVRYMFKRLLKSMSLNPVEGSNGNVGSSSNPGTSGAAGTAGNNGTQGAAGPGNQTAATTATIADAPDVFVALADEQTCDANDDCTIMASAKADPSQKFKLAYCEGDKNACTKKDGQRSEMKIAQDSKEIMIFQTTGKIKISANMKVTILKMSPDMTTIMGSKTITIAAN